MQKNLHDYLNAIDGDMVDVTRDGKPCAVLHGVGNDLETAELAHSAEF